MKRYEGKTLPQGNLTTERKTGAALASPFRFQKYGQSGIEVSEIFARTARHIDDICVIRSMHANTPNHEQSMRLMNCGDERLSRPSMGSWLTYGMGTENANLPGFIAMCPGLPVADVANWKSAFLPGVYQGTYIDTRKSRVEDLIENIRNTTVTRSDQRRQLDLLGDLNRMHQKPRAEDDALEARIASFELAYRMQMAATDAFDVSQEPQSVRDAYGPGVQAQQLLIARRLIERGVRFVQLYHGDVQPWDAHDHIAENHARWPASAIGPSRALLTDLKQRGLLRRDAGALRRRVRPHPGRRDGQRQARRRPRPQPLGIHRLAGRRRRPGRPRPRRRPTNSATRPSRSPCTSTTCTPRSCTCWASTTPGSPIATPAATSASPTSTARSSAISSPDAHLAGKRTPPAHRLLP